MSSVDISSIDKQLDAFIAKMSVNTTTVARGIAEEVMTTIIDEHPLDTTDPDDVVSKGDWIAEIGSEPGGVDRSDPTGNQAKSQINGVIGTWDAASGAELNIANDKHQTVMLEYGMYKHATSRTTAAGFSQQAPEGFVHINLMKAQKIADKEAKKVR